jgi:outer membrane cobalamin receptor
MPTIKLKGGRKRGFKAYSSAKEAGWDKPGGGGFPGDPFELTMKRVKLSDKTQPFGMDQSRKEKMRRTLWYWQWSRDWNWRQVSVVTGVKPDQAKAAAITVERQTETKTAEAAWYWHWPKKLKTKKRKGSLRKKVNKQGNELIDWIVSLNPRQTENDTLHN